MGTAGSSNGHMMGSMGPTSNDANNRGSSMQKSGSRANSSQFVYEHNLPPKGKFDRERSGKFSLIFPFNKKSEELAFAMNR